MRYAEVAVDAPVGHSRTFSYSIPGHLSPTPGQLVWVPFGRRTAQGLVMELTAAPQVEVTKDILQPIEPAPLLGRAQLRLARWISGYYLCPLFAAAALFLPPGFEDQVRSRLHRAEAAGPENDPEIEELLARLAARPGMEQAEFVKALGRRGERVLKRLIDRGAVRREVELPFPRLKPRYDCRLVPALDSGGADDACKPLSDRQARLLETVHAASEPYPQTLANKEFGGGTANALLRKGLLGQEWVRLEDDNPIPAPLPAGAGCPHELTADQANALSRIGEALDNPGEGRRSFLLYGVTGSGKTEVYLQAIQKALDMGRQAVYLVPEISLTPQTLERVSGRFPGRVAALHSRLTPRQQFDQWWKIREGECDVVVGPRSALFAPLPRLGLAVIDEEHEWTYKQEEAEPLYHARTVALRYARDAGAVVVMGSATPDVETYHRALAGEHELLTLPNRIGQPGRKGAGDGAPLAKVHLCDMRRELREGNRSIFSRGLSRALTDCVERGNQALLFLNRRGSASIVQCRSCGYVAECRSCSSAMAYHSADSSMMCHLCNRNRRLPAHCPQCGGSRIRRMGAGTQRVVEEAASLLPGATVERWDSDAARSGPAHSEAMSRFASGQTNVLVGTQMVAKGLDVPGVTLVGVVLADIGLRVPDFRAAERTFGLLCQVAGRAGRGSQGGEVYIQTYTPEHYAITAAAAQDYGRLYDAEIRSRRELGNPPFNELAHIVFMDTNANNCQRKATNAARALRRKVHEEGLTDVELIGPAPGIPSRLRGRHRWHVTLRGRRLRRFLDGIDLPGGSVVDVDPAHVL